jgi:hypothetical protein
LTKQALLTAACCAASMIAGPAFGQHTATAADQPDLSGIWQAMNTANWDLEAHAAAPGPMSELGALLAIPPGPGVVVDGAIPYLPEALPQREENRENRWTADPELKCYMPGVPRANYMPYPFQIIQGTDTIMLSYQFADAVRIIHMNDPGPAPAPSWMGWSVGRWEGDTLVVDVTGQNDQTWFDRSGNYHSEELHVVERYTLETPNILMYEATITDPNVFSRPWTIRMPLYRDVAENAQVMEFNCIPFVEDVLYGDSGK